ncbi:MAG: hypothetical protein KBD36_01805 [Alphaproteobacteria bacterium]|jgi:hypothetical protein|nr:hypothetical protein [Alphaproteobacteria bacterium]MBP9776567.1 hypothetical protein [Alphaproteobacteria bacterium]
MIKNIFQLYTLLICLICTIILIISSSMFLNSLTDLFIPEYKSYSSMVSYESNDNYLRYYERDWGIKDERYIALSQLSPDQLDDKRMIAKKAFLAQEKAQAIGALIHCLQWALVALAFFLIHWRLYKKSNKTIETIN